MNVAIQAVSGTNPVRYIYVQSMRPGSLNNNVSVAITENGGTFSCIRTIAAISAWPNYNDAEVWLTPIQISGSIGDPGSPHTAFVFADIVGQLTAGGAITADIQAGPRLFGGTSTLQRVQSTGSDILGHIYAPAGPIWHVEASGSIGASGNIIDIWSKGDNRKVYSGSVFANIDTKYDNGTGDFWYLETTGGSFSGSLNTRNLQGPNAGDGIFINGNLNGPIKLSEHVDKPIQITGSITSNGGINIAKGLRSGSGNTGSITLGTNGLLGQIVINSGNATSIAWGGDVTIGGTTLSPKPDYSNTSDSIGGGAVGQVPFKRQTQECSVSTPQNAGGRITLRFYGPVANTSSGINPVIVDYNIGQGWVDCSSNFNHSTTGRSVLLTAIDDLSFPVPPPYVLMRVRPRSNLVCDPSVITASGSVAVDQFDWQFMP